MLQAEAGPHLAATAAFLNAAARRGFPVRAWLVLCQNPELCIHNYRNEPYRYALCPAQPEVQAYILALIRDVSMLAGITGLDLEALSFMGYEHNSLHDKRAIPVDPQLNVCHCSVFQGHDDRIGVVADLLDRVRTATNLPFDLRSTDDPNFFEGCDGGMRWIGV